MPTANSIRLGLLPEQGHCFMNNAQAVRVASAGILQRHLTQDHVESAARALLSLRFLHATDSALMCSHQTPDIAIAAAFLEMGQAVQAKFITPASTYVHIPRWMLSTCINSPARPPGSRPPLLCAAAIVLSMTAIPICCKLRLH